MCVCVLGVGGWWTQAILLGCGGDKWENTCIAITPAPPRNYMYGTKHNKDTKRLPQAGTSLNANIGALQTNMHMLQQLSSCQTL